MAFAQLDVYLQPLSTFYNSCLILDSLHCCFQVRNEALMEPMVAFVQLDVYLQPLSTLISGHTRDLRDGETVTLQCISKEQLVKITK